jgi:hypothetical protein
MPPVLERYAPGAGTVCPRCWNGMRPGAGTVVSHGVWDVLFSWPSAAVVFL